MCSGIKRLIAHVNKYVLEAGANGRAPRLMMATHETISIFYILPFLAFFLVCIGHILRYYFILMMPLSTSPLVNANVNETGGPRPEESNER